VTSAAPLDTLWQARPESGRAAAMTSRLSLLVDLASLLTREVDFDSLLRTAGERVATALSAARATIWLVDAETGDLVARVADLPELPSLRQPRGKGVVGHVVETGETVRTSDAAADPRFDPSVDKVTGFVTRSILAVPIREDARSPVRGVLQVLNALGPHGFDEEDETYLVALAMQLGRAIALTTLRADDAAGPGVVLRGPFNRIVGRSPELASVYERIARAAETDATVLLRGETGTGKTLFSRAIHVNSARQTGPFVTVDCTTLPPQLVESEIFGHERGAFTGADRRVPGRVELAEGGTLFLDEIGDLPPEIQGKFLRFLQDRTFERVGGRTTLTADVRVVCATHRDLEQAVREGRFREDLYFRIRVVEIDIPPLRARGGDEIETLARHFADLYASRYGRPRPTFTPEVTERLRTHTWTGNVRELEHWVESAVVLAHDGVLRLAHLPTARLAAPGAPGEPAIPLGLSLEEATRRYIEAAVAAAGGNKSLAAKSLGVGRNTVLRALRGVPAKGE